MHIYPKPVEGWIIAANFEGGLLRLFFKHQRCDNVRTLCIPQPDNATFFRVAI